MVYRNEKQYTENKLNIALNDIDNDERSFDTVRDFIDWASSNL